MPKKGENIYKRKDNRWEGRIFIGYTEKGKRKYHSFYGKSYREVKRKLTELKKQTQIMTSQTKAITFNQVAEEWLKKQQLQVKTTTFCTYKRLLNRHIFPEFYTCRVIDISQSKIINFLYNKKKSGRVDGAGALSSKSIKDIQALLHSVFQYAEQEYGFKNPCCNLKIQRNLQPHIEILTRDEIKQLTNYLIKSSDIQNIGILISLYMGVRLGEICALKWSHISLENSILHIKSTTSRIINLDLEQELEEIEKSTNKTKLIIDSPKSTSSVRDIPIPSFIIEELQFLYNSELQNCYILTGDEQKCKDPRTYQKYFKKQLQLAGIRNINYHCLRHSFATLCLSLGFDIKTLSEILGHSSTTVTLNKYIHTSFSNKQEQMSKMEKATY